MSEPYIKLYKKMRSWEWYDDINTFRLFLHCLLRAEWKPGSWHGIKYEAGQFITSLPNLAKETGLSLQQVRTALDHLKSTGEVTDFRQGNARIITVVKWNEYQADNRPSNRPVTDLQQTFNRPLTACKEKEDIEELEEIEEVVEEGAADELKNDIQEIVDYWGENYTPLAIIPPKRYANLISLLQIVTVADVKKCIDKSKQAAFIKDKPFFTFDWFIDPDNFSNVLEGKYDKKFNKPASESINKKWGVVNDE